MVMWGRLSSGCVSLPPVTHVIPSPAVTLPRFHGAVLVSDLESWDEMYPWLASYLELVLKPEQCVRLRRRWRQSRCRRIRYRHIHIPLEGKPDLHAAWNQC